MTSLTRNFLKAVLFVGVVGIGSSAFGQESIRPSSTGVQAAEARKSIEEPQNYNLKLGPVFFDASGGFEVEANDNVGISEDHRESDLILRPSLQINSFWQATRLNAFHLNLGIAYSKYLDHSNLDTKGILLDPGSAFSYDIYVGDFRINLHDRIAILQNPVDEPGLSNVGNFNRVQNAVGLDVLWDLNDLKVVVGYDHFNFWSLQSEFDFLNRSEEQVYGSVSVDLNDANRVGVDANAAWVSYAQDYNNDGTTASSGLFWETQVSNYLKLRLAGGAQFFLFGNAGQNQDNSDFRGFYANGTLAHRLNSYITESLSVGHEARLGLTVNFDEMDYARYSAAWRTNRFLTTSLDAFFEHANESGSGITSEELVRFGGGVTLACQVSRRSTATLRYLYTNKDSDVALRSYYQNRLILGVNYDF